LLVEEFESNLAIITLLSQQRHDSIYRANARKILQFMAAVRLDPENVHSPIMNSYAVNDGDGAPSSDELNACPPTTNHMGTRERVLSDEGKRLFLAGHGYAPPTGANGAPGTMKPPGSEVMPHHSRQGSYGSTQYGDDDDETASQASSYQPPAPWQNGSYNPPYRQPGGYQANGSAHAYGNGNGNGTYQPREPQQQQPPSSAFGFMAQQSAAPAAPPVQAPPQEHQTPGSAFGFIASAQAGDEDDASTGRPSVTGFDFIAQGSQAPSGPTPPRVRVEDFLVEDIEGDRDEFDVMWESTTDSYVSFC
jgi:hypothetical protein